MTRVSLLVIAVVAAVGCGGGAQPQTTAAPQPNADSLAAAQAKARQDSIAAAQADSARKAQEDAERIARQRAADSLAALSKTSDDVKAALTAMVHFDFDKSAIRGEDQSALDQKIAILQANPDLHIRISGHCDERGSDEYNLALGNRRATSTKQYLVSHGIDASRIETVSYGEERPLDPGHTEDAWAKNRRAEFEIVSGGDVLKKP